jgi:hypothetical protein
MIFALQRPREVFAAVRGRWQQIPLRWPLVGLGSALLGLDVLRAVARPALETASPPPSVLVVTVAQWIVGLLTLALVALALRRSGLDRTRAACMLALGLLLLGTYVSHSQELRSDGVLYYSYLRSALFDFDLALGNDFLAIDSRLSPDFVNPLPIGTPILWAPFVVPLHLLWQAARLFGAAAPRGVEAPYQAMACLATFIYGALALFLLLDTLGRWSRPAIAFWTTLIIWLGSPLRFYLVTIPSLPHGCEFLAAVLVLRAWLALRARICVGRAVWAGLACGLVFLVRSQDGLLLGLPLIELGLAFVRGPERRSTLRSTAALLLAFLLAALPQLLVWQAMFGRPLLVPHTALHGDSFMHLDRPRLFDTLLSARGGLFASHPMALLAVVGLVGMALRRRRNSDGGPGLDGRYVLAALPVLLAAWYVNATVFDWYQVRRFTGIVPLLAPGLLVVVGFIGRRGWMAPALLTFCLWRYDLEVDRLRSGPGAPAPVQAVLARISDGVAADGLRLLAPVAPRTTAALFAAYSGEAPLEERVTRFIMGADVLTLRLPWLARNLTEPEVEDGRICRWVSNKSATVYLLIRTPRALIVSVDARALETPMPQTIEARWNGCVLGRQTMEPAWHIYRFHATAGCVRAGRNEVIFAFEHAPVYRRIRGVGPHQVRPAAFAEITLHHDAP